MTEGMVTVVIPTFNRQQLLADAVSSVLTQTYLHREVVIVDDGSTDGTEVFVENRLTCEWKGHPIRYFKKSNGGPASSRQYGMEKAHGEFIQFLDSDDVLMPSKLERQIKAMRDLGPSAECCSCYGRKGPKANGWARAIRIGFHGSASVEFLRAMCLPHSFPMHCIAPIWRKSYLTTREGWPENLCCSEDWAYYTRLIAGVRLVAFVEEDLFWACDHEGERASVTEIKADGNLRKMISSAKAIEMVEQCIRSKGMFDHETQTGLLRICRSVYSLLLECGATPELACFEKYIHQLASNPRAFDIVLLPVCLRSLLGTKIIQRIVRRYTMNQPK